MDHAPVLELKPAGWLVALLAGAVAAGLTAWTRGAGLPASAIIGLVTFGVFGVLLGKGGVELNAATEGHSDHHHGHH
jgi:hypothetical protein